MTRARLFIRLLSILVIAALLFPSCSSTLTAPLPSSTTPVTKSSIQSTFAQTTTAELSFASTPLTTMPTNTSTSTTKTTTTSVITGNTSPMKPTTPSAITSITSTMKPAPVLGVSNHFGANAFGFYYAYINDQTRFDSLETVVNYFNSETNYMVQAGIGWDRTLSPWDSGQFRRATIEKSQGVYDWSWSDAFVNASQHQGLQSDVLLGPWTPWDQPGVEEKYYGKPNNMAAWKAFVQSVVERYDGDGQADMPGLRYGIKYWEIGNEPEIGKFNHGNVQEYVDTLKAAYEAVKAADADSRVLSAGASPIYDPGTGQLELRVESFWKQFFTLGGGVYMDILSIHHTCPNPAPPPLVKFLEKFTAYGKDIWVTEFGTYSGAASVKGTSLPEQTEVYQANYLVKNTVDGFAHGMKKVFWTVFRRQSTPNDPSNTWTWAVSMIKSDGTGKLVYNSQQVLSTKIDGFSSVQELGDGRFKFIVNGKPVYVLWGDGQLPAELTGQVRITYISGRETSVMVSELKLTDNPVFVEP